MDARLVGRVIDMVRSVNPLLAVNAAVLDLNQPPASGHVRAQVAARLADGTFRVLIDGKALKLALPADIKPGDVLQLRIAGRESDAAHSPAAAPGKGVSSAGQLVADLVRQPAGAPPRQAQPILELPPQRSQAIAAPLARAVERSGLFYESHQARWVGGEYPLEQLLQEPQAGAAATRAPEHAPASDSGGSDEAQHRVAARPGVGATPLADETLDTSPATPVSAQETREAASKAVERAAADIVAKEMLPVVRQQLETLETRHFQWLGEIWPGQSMHWEIGEDAAEDTGSRDTAREWDSRFTLALPALGQVGAELALVGNRLRIRLSAEDATTAAMMREAAHELHQALAAVGIEPRSFEVMQRESTF